MMAAQQDRKGVRMKKSIFIFALAFSLLFSACAKPAEVEPVPAATPAPTPVPVTAADLLADALKYYEAGDYEEAIIAYMGVIEIEPKNFDAQFGLAQTYLSAQDEEAAIEAFVDAITIDRSRPESYIGLSNIYLARGDHSAALSILQEGMKSADAKVLGEKIEVENLAEMKLLRQSSYSSSDELEGFILYEYGEGDLLKKSEEYTLFKVEEGDGDLLVTLLTGGYADGIRQWETIYEYNAHKQIIKEVCYCYTGSDPDVYFVYKYDGDILIQVRCYDLDDDWLYWVDDDPEWSVYKPEDGHVEDYDEADGLEYDGQGRLIKRDGAYGYEIYEYDGNGRLKKKSEFSAEGELQQYDIYEYGFQKALADGDAN